MLSSISYLNLCRRVPSFVRGASARRRATLADPQAAAAALAELNAELAGFGGELPEPPAQAGGGSWPLAAQTLPPAQAAPSSPLDAVAPLRGATCDCGGCGCRAPPRTLHVHVHVHVHGTGGTHWELPASAVAGSGSGGGGGGGGGDATHVHVHVPAAMALR